MVIMLLPLTKLKVCDLIFLVCKRASRVDTIFAFISWKWRRLGFHWVRKRNCYHMESESDSKTQISYWKSDISLKMRQFSHVDLSKLIMTHTLLDNRSYIYYGYINKLHHVFGMSVIPRDFLLIFSQSASLLHQERIINKRKMIKKDCALCMRINLTNFNFLVREYLSFITLTQIYLAFSCKNQTRTIKAKELFR